MCYIIQENFIVIAIKRLFLPLKSNNYHPLLLRKKSLLIYSLILFVFNVTVGSLPVSRAYAAVNTSTIIQLHNSERTSRGLGTLIVNSALVNSAAAKAQAMLDSDCWSHYCPNGKSPWDFFASAGYTYIFAGENLAEGFSDNEAVMTAWMNSPTHRDNVLKSEFREIGIGVVQGAFQGNPNNTIIVVHFGTQVNSFSTLPSTNEGIGITQPTDTIPPEKPVIDVPADGDYLNDPLFSVQGKSEENSTVDIFDNDLLKGSVGTEGGIFDYKPPTDNPFEEGSHILSAFAKDESANRSIESEEISVTVDTIKPSIYADSFEVLSTDHPSVFRFRIPVESETQSVTLNTELETVDLVHIPNSIYWEGDFTEDNFSGQNTVEITAIDKANNKTTVEISSGEILGAAAAVGAQISPTSINLNSLGAIIARELPKLKNIVSFIFVLLIGGLFTLDAYLLAKTNISHNKRGKHHLHLSMFLILILSVFIGGIGGNILEGLSL